MSSPFETSASGTRTTADWRSAGPGGLPIPLSVSWHLWPRCNFHCAHC